MRIIYALVLYLILIGCFTAAAWSQEPEQTEYKLEATRRINAHSDELNSVVLTPDERHLIIGTEKGDVIVWGLSEKRALRSFNQGSPVHQLILLGDGRHVVAAGGWHTSEDDAGKIRRWNIETGEYQEMPSGESASFITLAYDGGSGIIAAADIKGRITAWSERGGITIGSWDFNKLISGLALIGKTAYLTSIDPKDLESVYRGGKTLINTIEKLDLADPASSPRPWITKDSGRFWQNLIVSPDGKFLGADCIDKDQDRRVVILDVKSGSIRGDFEGQSMAWSRNDQFILFGQEWPSQLIRLHPDGKNTVKKFPEGPKWHAAGHPTRLSSAVASRDGSKVWGAYRQGAALVQWDRKNERAEILTMKHGSVYAMHVRGESDGSGLLMTGGDDGFARVWNLKDLSLRREFQMPNGVPQGVGLLSGGSKVVVSCSTGESPTDILIADIVTGEIRKLFTLNYPGARVYAAGENFIYGNERKVILASSATGAAIREFEVSEPISSFNISANAQWLVMCDAKETLYLFNVNTGREAARHNNSGESLGRLIVKSDGSAVYGLKFPEELMKWDVKSGSLKTLTHVRTGYTIHFSDDETKILFGGRHRDLAIYDAADGSGLFAGEATSADFYVTNLWLSGDRLIFTTDAGVIIDGKAVLSRSPGK